MRPATAPSHDRLLIAQLKAKRIENMNGAHLPKYQ